MEEWSGTSSSGTFTVPRGILASLDICHAVATADAKVQFLACTSIDYHCQLLHMQDWVEETDENLHRAAGQNENENLSSNEPPRSLTLSMAKDLNAVWLLERPRGGTVCAVEAR